MKYAYLVLLGVLIAVLAGCGGGGDGGKGDMITMLETDLEKVQAELDEAQGKLKTTKDTLTETQGELETTKETLTTTQDTLETTKEALTTTQDTLTGIQDSVDALLRSAGVGTLMDLSTKLDADGKAFTTLDAQVKGLLARAGVMSLADLSTKLGNDEAAFNTLNSQVEGLLVKAGVMSLAALSNKLDEAGEAYTTLQGEVDAVLAATTGVAGGLPALRMAYDTAKTDYDTLNMQVNTVLAATTGMAGGLPALQTAYDKAKSDYDTLNTQVQDVLTATDTTSLTALQTAVASLRSRVSSLLTQLGQAQDDEREAQQQAQTLEANQRAENLRQAFQGSDDMILTSPPGDSPVTITVQNRSSRPTFSQGDRTVSQTTASGFQVARLTRTRGGTNTTVVYTDRELSRVLLDHYASTESMENPGQFTLPSLTSTTNLYHQTTSTLTIPERLLISSRGGLPSSIPADETGDRGREEVRTSFSGSVQGVSGTFRCQGDGCMLTAMGTYHDADDDLPETPADPNANRLDMVTLVPTSGMIYFKPSNAAASVSLCENTAQCLVDDTEYMAFGWWREAPANAVDEYKFEVFANVEGTAGTNSSLDGTAEYDGTAVGMYVEQGGLGGTGVTTKQGEFTADVRLDVDFDNDASDVNDIEGTIDGFRTTPTGGSSAPTTSSTWVVKLVAADAANMDTLTGSDSATIPIRGASSTGAWSYTFVDNHATAPTGNDQLQPPAVTGTFNTRIPNLLHLVGAFGAELQ